MNQVSNKICKSEEQSLPLFGSIWIALYCLLRHGQGKESIVVETDVSLKKTGLANRH